MQKFHKIAAYLHSPTHSCTHTHLQYMSSSLVPNDPDGDIYDILDPVTDDVTMDGHHPTLLIRGYSQRIQNDIENTFVRSINM